MIGNWLKKGIFADDYNFNEKNRTSPKRPLIDALIDGVDGRGSKPLWDFAFHDNHKYILKIRKSIRCLHNKLIIQENVLYPQTSLSLELMDNKNKRNEEKKEEEEENNENGNKLFVSGFICFSNDNFYSIF